MQKEKEFLKSKIAEIDSKCRELEKKKSELIFDFEKEKVNYNIYIMHLLFTKLFF